MAHGGMTTGFADIVTSFVVFESRTPRAEVLTISLTTDFLSIAPLGSWVEGRGKVIQMGSSVAFSTCEIFADGKLIGHASGKFKVRARH
jgi:acyl-coenzyme A thioesterase PaaI-like protein